MPVISRFFGIMILMNYNDHEPPHFHARYQDQEIIVGDPDRSRDRSDVEAGAAHGS